VIERQRSIVSAKHVLVLALEYAINKASLRTIAALAHVIGADDVDSESWRKKFLKCEEWLFYLLQRKLSENISTNLTFHYGGKQNGSKSN